MDVVSCPNITKTQKILGTIPGVACPTLIRILKHQRRMRKRLYGADLRTAVCVRKERVQRRGVFERIHAVFLLL
jgi:hypothetical protein